MLDVACRFVEHDVTGAPVTDEEGRCVGFFSTADFLRRELRARQESPDGSDGDPLAKQAEVGRFMSDSVTTIKPGEPLLSAARLMCENHLHRLPVVDDSGHIVGILSTMDIVAALVNAIDEMDSSHFPGLGA
jgi:CBS domain-containing protein